MKKLTKYEWMKEKVKEHGFKIPNLRSKDYNRDGGVESWNWHRISEHLTYWEKTRREENGNFSKEIRDNNVDFVEKNRSRSFDYLESEFQQLFGQ